ncbi:MAG TPA: mucoidy inhibitor MuiA family protein [Desulfuromonadales bacterium]|nr:mucoidy inhibitor MuiA family protein [Desulfuromonadales bacterium]
MKILNLVSALAFMLLPSVVFSAEIKRIPLASSITAVTVYNDRALTTRSSTLTSLKPGTYQFLFEGLPALIQDDSVRVDGKGSAATTIAGLEIRRQFLEQAPDKRSKELEEEIRVLERRSGALDAKKTGLTAQKSFFESIRVAWGDRISKELAIGRPTSAELLDASSFVASGVTKVEEQFRDIENEKKNIRDKVDALRRQQEESSGYRRKETKTVEVTVEVAQEGSLTLELAAVTMQAAWEPTYDVRLAADAKTADFTFRAMVRQLTGEDWNNVNLTLSTARPAAGGAPPELHPWQVSAYRPSPPMAAQMSMPAPLPAAKAKKADRRMKAGAGSEEGVAEDVAAAFATAQVSGEQTSVMFKIPRQLTIPSDGTRHGSVVSVENVPVAIEFMAIPKLSPSVFLKSEIVNRFTYPLLAGKVNTFTGTTFTGSSQLKKVAAGDKFDLFFGNDDQVTVKREELKQHKEAGVFGKNRVSYRYRIELANFRKEPLTVILRDQLPVAGDEEIKVTLDDPSVKPDEMKSDGTVTWKTPLQPGDKKELTFGIIVEYPKEREISGL